jgi:hypothetical protein
MANTYYASGSWNAICDTCGFEYKSHELKKTWNGLWVCSKDWEARNAQEFVRGVKDVQKVPWSRDESPDVFTAVASGLTPTPGGTL